MAKTDLLSAVLSSEGWYCIVGLKKTGTPKQIFVQTLEEAEKEIDDLVAKHYDAYFACAKYEAKKTRTGDNIKAVRAFWLDIDCGESKPYKDKAEGVNALKAFCDAAGLPRPYLVDSGRGVHAYWPLTADITKQQWKPVADRLKVVCHEHGLDADPARTADVASILRVPETFNFKEDPPLNVAVILPAPATDFETFKAALGGSLDEIPDYAAGQINELTRALMGNKQHRFSTIMLSS